MTPEEKARVKIDKQLNNAGWDIVSRDEYIPMSTTAVKEGLMQGNTESDYLLFIDNKCELLTVLALNELLGTQSRCGKRCKTAKIQHNS